LSATKKPNYAQTFGYPAAYLLTHSAHNLSLNALHTNENSALQMALRSRSIPSNYKPSWGWRMIKMWLWNWKINTAPADT
jgi:hypothetical protein